LSGSPRIESDLAERPRAKQRDPEPNDDDEYALHFAGLADVLDFMNCTISIFSWRARRVNVHHMARFVISAAEWLRNVGSSPR